MNLPYQNLKIYLNILTILRHNLKMARDLEIRNGVQELNNTNSLESRINTNRDLREVYTTIGWIRILFS